MATLLHTNNHYVIYGAKLKERIIDKEGISVASRATESIWTCHIDQKVLNKKSIQHLSFAIESIAQYANWTFSQFNIQLFNIHHFNNGFVISGNMNVQKLNVQ